MDGCAVDKCKYDLLLGVCRIRKREEDSGGEKWEGGRKAGRS
jgi:hypothetical protein